MMRIFKPEIIISIIIFGILLIFTFTTNTTGDSGDSIAHYLYAHYAFKYPNFFLHHWAKPIFVLFSAPFAQFGFKGIIIFNTLCATLSGLLAFYTAKNLKIKQAWLVFVFIFFAPFYFKLIFSGLTEYLFALVLILGIYLVSKSKYTYASIIVSFLPLIRSEGLIILGVFGLYFLLDKKIKNLPYLFFGQLIYTVFGAFYYKDIFWVLNKIPYAHISSPYGSGQLLDFVHRLNYVIEKPIYLLLVIGSVSLTISFFRTGFKGNNNVKILLILGSFLSFFIAHSIFWWLGIFNSMGLPRVLIAVVPVIALLALMGMETITVRIHNPKIVKTLLFFITLLIGVYPFTNRENGIVFNDQLFVLEENRLMDQKVVPYIKKELPDYESRIIYSSQPYLTMGLNIDFFDTNHHRELHHLLGNDIKMGSIIIWDNWYGIIQGNVALNQLTDDPRFELLKTFEGPESNKTVLFAIFKTLEDIPYKK
jgi:hypothetical protein